MAFKEHFIAVLKTTSLTDNSQLNRMGSFPTGRLLQQVFPKAAYLDHSYVHNYVCEVPEIVNSATNIFDDDTSIYGIGETLAEITSSLQRQRQRQTETEIYRQRRRWRRRQKWRKTETDRERQIHRQRKTETSRDRDIQR